MRKLFSRISARIRAALRHVRLPARNDITALDVTVWVALSVAAVSAVVFSSWLFGSWTVTVQNNNTANGGTQIGPGSGALTGTPCEQAGVRPLAVMVASDPEARPLSGIGEADMVFEMPVTPNGITRMMAVFQCGTPREVGSIRSARNDFIPLVQGLHAIYAHWGGEHEALDRLNAGATDNVDALKYEGTVYYRKTGIARPHNGFTTLEAVREKAAALGYAASVSISPYLHAEQTPERNLASLTTEVTVAWPQGMGVTFRYDPATNRYLRERGGTPEIDKLTGDQVAADVVIVMTTDATLNYDQYINVRVIGDGVATIYQAGRRISARWKKPTASDMLSFIDGKGAPIPLAPGMLWVLIDAPLP